MQPNQRTGSGSSQLVESSKPRTGLVTLLFTDMVGSTALKQQLGDKTGSAFFDQHHQLVRETLRPFSGAQEIETAGDSFLITFSTPSDAVQFALLLQARLKGLSQKSGVSAQDRVGIHLGEVVIKEDQTHAKPKDLYGIQIDACSRVMSLAKGGQTLMTRAVFDSARQVLKGEDIEGVGQLEWLNHGSYLLKGLEEALEICEVREAGQLVLSPPTSSEKAQRRVAAGDEHVLGWRPAVGQLIPNTKWVLQEKLGEGGFGEVWLGLHQTMKEQRVFKFCFHAERVRFLKRELTLFRLLKERIGDHPNIVRLHEIFLDAPPCYVEMDYVDGKDLRTWAEARGGISNIPLPVRLEIVAQAAEALKAAHDSGIIHRDVKPSNILVSKKEAGAGETHVKLTDFGIGQVVSQEYLAGITRAGFTETISSSSAQSGTQLYMAPELLAGRAASIQSDIYSLGIVLYQLLVGDFSEPLTTDWAEKVSDPVLREDLRLCFAGDPANRFTDAGELAKRLRGADARRRTFSLHARRNRLGRQLKAAGVLAAILVLALSLTWTVYKGAKTRSARALLPQIAALADADKSVAAFELARKADVYLHGDPTLTNLLRRVSFTTSFVTTPLGAEVYLNESLGLEKPWQLVGKTPLYNVQLAATWHRWRLTKEGYVTVDRRDWLGGGVKIALDPLGSLPPGMVRVRGSTNFKANLIGLRGTPATEFGDFLIDKFEVRNRQFNEFVGRGGYEKTNFWSIPFTKAGTVLSWTEAMAKFRDKTGKPGPATWRNGSYPPGQEQYPVSGISWYEAAAYAQFAGKQLPTVYHWEVAANPGSGVAVVPLSNFGSKGPAPVDQYQGMSPWGVFGMAGNVAEWCWNDSGSGKRYALGGAWDEREYVFLQAGESEPFDRAPTRGFRCIKDLSPPGNSKRALDPVPPAEFRDFSKEKPVSDEIFQVYRAFFSYDKALPLDPVVDSVREESESWKKERIVFKAAYGSETVPAYLFLPKKASAPFQAFVYFPGTGAFRAQPSSTAVDLADTDIVFALLTAGRAVLYPVYQGSYERAPHVLPATGEPSPAEARDSFIQQAKDFLRAVDYLETRGDIDHSKLGYAGLSLGGLRAPVLLASDNRVRVAILLHGGFGMGKAIAPEIDSFNYAPRVTIPVLMLNGRHDFIFPVEASQLPFFRMLGTPPEHKQHILYERAHYGPPMDELTKQVKSWADKYLGPVK